MRKFMPRGDAASPVRQRRRDSWQVSRGHRRSRVFARDKLRHTIRAMPAAAIERFTLEHCPSPVDDFATSVRAGLTATRKRLEPRFFYDELGSALFDAICSLPEYYVTRAETDVLTMHGDEIAAALPAPARLVELGSGSARKTRLLLDAILQRQRTLDYAPVDVDATMLEKTGQALLSEYEQLRIHAVCADFREPA